MTRHWQATILALLGAAAISGRAGEISTGEILTQTAEATFACLNWQPVGVCLWLQCDLAGCRVQSSIKVGHYLPELVVTSYNELGGNPWREAQVATGAIAASPLASLISGLAGVLPGSAGHRSEATFGRDHANLVFREADAIGHPAPALPVFALPDSLRCRSRTRPFVPYFLSSLDAVVWRTGGMEIFESASWLPGSREIGQWPLNTWGGVYPRTGWAISAEEPKAAAVIAQRVGDIVTRDDQAHVYRAIVDRRSRTPRTWPPGPLFETDRATGQWQMLLPEAQSTCEVVGIDDRHAAPWSLNNVDTGGDYAWNLWRPYQCCQRRGQSFLGDLNFVTYP